MLGINWVNINKLNTIAGETPTPQQQQIKALWRGQDARTYLKIKALWRGHPARTYLHICAYTCTSRRRNHCSATCKNRGYWVGEAGLAANFASQVRVVLNWVDRSKLI